MKLRELLKRAGNLARLLPLSEDITVLLKDCEDGPSFIIWFSDEFSDDGAVYRYFCDDGTFTFYSIPREGEPNPEGAKSAPIDWDSEDFVISIVSLDDLDAALKHIQADLERVREDWK